MAQVTPTQVNPGEEITAASVNTPNNELAEGINNIDNSQISASAAIAHSKMAADNGITANMIGNSAICLGYVQVTSNQAGIGGSPTQVTGLTLTVTIPNGSRKIKITAFARDLAPVGGGGYIHWQIWDGTVGSGTMLADSQPFAGAASAVVPAMTIAVVTPAAGSKTYNVGAWISANTLTLEAAATYPAFLLVEAI